MSKLSRWLNRVAGVPEVRLGVKIAEPDYVGLKDRFVTQGIDYGVPGMTARALFDYAARLLGVEVTK